MKKSVFAADLRVFGDVASKGDLDVHGHVEGTVSVKDLTVSRNAAIEGRVRAVSATVAGRIDGHLECDTVAIESSGRVDGDVAYRTLSMVVGGVLNAHCMPQQGSVAAADTDAGVRAEGAAAGPARKARGEPAAATARLPLGASA